MIATASTIPAWSQLGSVVKIDHPLYKNVHAVITSFPNRTQAIVNIPGVGRETLMRSQLHPIEECTHSWQPCWNENGELVDYCWGCNSYREITDVEVFQQWEQKMNEVVVGYQKEFDKSKSKGKREQVGRAIARCHEQLEWLKKKLNSCSHEEELEKYSSDASVAQTHNSGVGMMEELLKSESLATTAGAENKFEATAQDNTTTATVDAVFDFIVGDRVSHKNGRFTGTVTELDFRLAAPQVWVQPDVEPDCEVSPPKPFNPSDLVKVEIENSQVTIVTYSDPMRSLTARGATKSEIQSDLMTKQQAQECINQIRDYVSTIRQLLIELDICLGWKALGYSNMTACITGELKSKSKTALIYELQAGRIEKNLEVPIGTYKESQLRPLVKLKPEYQPTAIKMAKTLAGSRSLTAKDVSQSVAAILLDNKESAKTGIVDKLKEKPLHYASEYASDGEIFMLQRLKGEDSKYNGYWGLAIETQNRLTVKCQVYDSMIEIRQEHIKRVDMNKQQSTKQREVFDRVARLARCNLDEGAWKMLEVLNRQVNHSDYQLRWLEFTERYYGIYDYKN